MKEKLNKYLIAFSLTALFIMLWTIIRSGYYALSLIIISIYLFDNRDRLKPAIISLSFFIIIYLPAIVLAENVLYENILYDKAKGFESFLLGAVIALPVILFPVYFINTFFIKAIIIANFEKDNFNTVNSFPNVICTKHHRKTEQYSFMGFKGLHCRMSKKCFPKGHVAPLKLVGVIGKLVEEYEGNGEYFVTLWNPFTEEIYDADYDIVEIHNNFEVASYDGTINKIINYFYNELNRYKPISEVKIRIINNPTISENSRRLLEQKFLKVEYLQY